MGRLNNGSVFVLVAIALSAACAPVAPPLRTALATASPSITPDPTSTPTETPAPTKTITPSPTPTLPAYPNLALPGMERLHEIIQAGLRGGMRSGVFSKVGDSLTANGYFLTPFGSGNYDLGEHAYLQDAIDFFSREDAREGNSFVNDSLAAKSGWRAENVLDPSKNRSPCEAGETPLACEYRIVRPAIAVILLGTNDAAAPTGKYKESMQSIVALSVSLGILPILTTLPSMDGKDVEPYNAVIRELAEAGDLPLIDLYAALAALPHHGLAPDGIHLSWVEPAVFRPPYLNHGMTVRNLLTLQALDAVWRSYSSPP